MTKEQNILYAKKYIKENIYNSVIQENLNVTFLQTIAILENGIINNVHSDDVNIIFNLRNAWNFVLLNIDTKIDIDFIKKLHEKIGLNQALEVGKFRPEESIVYINGKEFKSKSIFSDKILKK